MAKFCQMLFSAQILASVFQILFAAEQFLPQFCKKYRYVVFATFDFVSPGKLNITYNIYFCNFTRHDSLGHELRPIL